MKKGLRMEQKIRIDKMKKIRNCERKMNSFVLGGGETLDEYILKEFFGSEFFYTVHHKGTKLFYFLFRMVWFPQWVLVQF